MGAGAIVSTAFLPQLRRTYARDALVLRGSVLQSAAMAVVAFAPDAWVAVPAMFAAGMAWITTANTLSVSAQMGLPDWVRARGMSMYQMAIMGASALGAALWGQVATVSSVQISLCIAAATGVLAMFAANRCMPHHGIEEDLTPARVFPARGRRPPASGQMMVTIEYRIDPARADEFRALMQESRRSRLSHGALSWELLRDLDDPGRFVEQIVDPSWTTTCAALTASPPPTPRCASASWPFTSASRRRW
jgi:MFS family permease